MALQVWLPLNGDLKNHGVGTITNPSGNPTFVKSITGKGIDTTKEAYSFTCNELEDCDSFTVAFWVKVNTDSTITGNYWDVLSLGDQNLDKTIIVNNQLRFEANYDSPKGIIIADNGYYNVFDSVISFNTGNDTWHHVALIVDNENNTRALYRDGVEISKTTRSTSGNASSGFYPGTGTLTGQITIGTQHPNAIISDIRIYDTAISPKEIKEISKGLICHYTLNNPNMSASSEPVELDVSGFDNHLDYINGQSGATYNTALSTPKYSGYYDYTSNPSYLMSSKPAIDFLPTESITVSIWVYLPDTSTGIIDINEPLALINCDGQYTGGFGLYLTANEQSGFLIYCKDANTHNAVVYAPSFSNKWALITGTYDGKTICIYENAILKSSASASDSIFYSSVFPLVINGTLNGSSINNISVSSMQKLRFSDARIYCTALSQSDILALYQERESITNKNVLLGELKEDSSATKASFTSTGIMSYVATNEDHLISDSISLNSYGSTEFKRNFSNMELTDYLAKLVISAASTTDTGICLNEISVPSGNYLEITVEFLQTSAVHFEMGIWNVSDSAIADSSYAPICFINRSYTTGSSISSNINIWNTLRYRVYNSSSSTKTFAPYIYFTAYDLKTTTSDTTFYLRHFNYRISKLYNTFGSNIPTRIVSSTKTILTNNEFIEN